MSSGAKMLKLKPPLKATAILLECKLIPVMRKDLCTKWTNREAQCVKYAYGLLPGVVTNHVWTLFETSWRWWRLCCTYPLNSIVALGQCDQRHRRVMKCRCVSSKQYAKLSEVLWYQEQNNNQQCTHSFRGKLRSTSSHLFSLKVISTMAAVPIGKWKCERRCP